MELHEYFENNTQMRYIGRYDHSITIPRSNAALTAAFPIFCKFSFQISVIYRNVMKYISKLYGIPFISISMITPKEKIRFTYEHSVKRLKMK